MTTTKSRLTTAQLQEIAALRSAGTPWSKITQAFGAHEQTIKKELHRAGLMSFQGAKYDQPLTTTTNLWSRPCSVCGSTKPRPRWQYRCDPCKARLDDGLPDEINFYSPT